ncbi:MAG: hypothetical protein IPJ85_13355 [Flavobacteriales bacterium]|nr:hypothetical protein [Flavobacteriales bacterium]
MAIGHEATSTARNRLRKWAWRAGILLALITIGWMLRFTILRSVGDALIHEIRLRMPMRCTCLADRPWSARQKERDW